MMLLLMLAAGVNCAWAQNETYDFKDYQEKNATIVMGDDWYEGITHAHPATNITLNNNTIEGLHNNFGTRFAFRHDDGKGWWLNKEKGELGRHGLRCMGTTLLHYSRHT